MSASSTFNTILIVGATSGIGAAFARRFHAQGKKLILTGRRADRLAALTDELPGTSSHVMDNTDLAALPTHIDTLFTTHPDIDTVWINSGLQNTSSLKDPSTSTDQAIITEITTNITAPYLFARHIIPRLLARSTATSRPTTFIITSSGLAFVPVPLFPVYNSTKAAIHSYLVALRQQMKDTPLQILELVPPYVETELDEKHRGEINVPAKPMKLQDFTDEIFEQWDRLPAGELKEVAAGTAKDRVGAWRGSIGEMLKNSGMGG